MTITPLKFQSIKMFNETQQIDEKAMTILNIYQYNQ